MFRIQIAELDRQISRCDREIREMASQPPTAPAWLVTLGMEDWEAEKRILLRLRQEAADRERHADPS